MNTEFYVRKILEILDHKSFYKVLGNESTKQTMKKITNVMNLAKDITRHEINWILDFECKTSRFYRLPKT